MFFITTTYNFLTTGQLVIVSTFHISLFLLLSYSLTETMPRKYHGSGNSSLGGSEKDRYFLKIPKWEHKLWECKRGKLVTYFLNDTVKTCSFELKISENILIKHAFESKVFLHLSNTLHTSCLKAFNFVSYF